MSQAMVVLGDWNATPEDRGRYSPHWVAARAGLRIHSAGPGRHGDIDYPMADCHVYGAERIPPPAGASRSDHDVVAFTAYHPEAPGDRWLTMATWNLRYGRPPRVVAAQVRQVLSQLDLDVLACQEAADYHRELGQIPGYRLVAFPQEGRWHNAILVKEGHALRRPASKRLSRFGWRLAGRAGSHSPLYATTVVVDWLRVMVIHMPPSVNWRAGVIYGPPMRVAAYASAAGRIVRLVRRNRAHRRP